MVVRSHEGREPVAPARVERTGARARGEQATRPGRRWGSARRPLRAARQEHGQRGPEARPRLPRGCRSGKGEAGGGNRTTFAKRGPTPKENAATARRKAPRLRKETCTNGYVAPPGAPSPLFVREERTATKLGRIAPRERWRLNAMTNEIETEDEMIERQIAALSPDDNRAGAHRDCAVARRFAPLRAPVPETRLPSRRQMLGRPGQLHTFACALRARARARRRSQSCSTATASHTTRCAPRRLSTCGRTKRGSGKSLNSKGASAPFLDSNQRPSLASSWAVLTLRQSPSGRHGARIHDIQGFPRRDEENDHETNENENRCSFAVRRAAVIRAVCLAAMSALADDHVVVQPNALKWGPAPPGCRPARKSRFSAAIREATAPMSCARSFRRATRVAPHTHPTAENVDGALRGIPCRHGRHVRHEERRDLARRRLLPRRKGHAALCVDHGADRDPDPRPRPVRHHLRQSGGRSAQQDLGEEIGGGEQETDSRSFPRKRESSFTKRAGSPLSRGRAEVGVAPP